MVLAKASVAAIVRIRVSPTAPEYLSPNTIEINCGAKIAGTDADREAGRRHPVRESRRERRQPRSVADSADSPGKAAFMSNAGNTTRSDSTFVAAA